MTTLFFVQHGKAVSKDINPDRPLSDIGAAEVHKIASHLSSHGVVVKSICHSGKLRASQTAEIFAQILKVKNLKVQKGLNPKDDPRELIKQFSDNQTMYIGHLPNLEKVISAIICSDTEKSVLSFQNAAVACLELQREAVHLKWYITPELC